MKRQKNYSRQWGFLNFVVKVMSTQGYFCFIDINNTKQ